MTADSSNDETERALISQLRDEAKAVKDCFTQFMFQALGLCTAATGLVAVYQLENPTGAVAHVFVCGLLLAVTRIGIYKYGTANRDYGYELHLQRTRALADDPPNGWRSTMRNVGWEEAMRAWRIVQATVYEALHTYGSFRVNRLRPPFRSKSVDDKAWFSPARLADMRQPRFMTSRPHVSYHPGTYLRTAITMLHSLSLVSVFLLWIGLSGYPKPNGLGREISLTIASLVTAAWLWNWVWTRRRLEILEGGMLSIHSCAVMWQVVVLAHYRALSRLRQPGGGSLKSYLGYTKAIADEADDLRRVLVDATSLLDIDQWTDGSRAPLQ